MRLRDGEGRIISSIPFFHHSVKGAPGFLPLPRDPQRMQAHYTDRFDLISHGESLNMKVYLNWDVTIDPAKLYPLSDAAFNSTFVSGTTHGDPYCDPI